MMILFAIPIFKKKFTQNPEVKFT